MDTNKLKHCPFCNEIACIGIDVDGSVSGTVGAAQVSCIGCGVTTPFFVDVYDAVETWNARAERTCKLTHMLLSHEEQVEAAYCECGQELDRLHTWEPLHLPNYCPNCGVKVKE